MRVRAWSPTVRVSSLFLDESFKKLTADQDEQFSSSPVRKSKACWCSTSTLSSPPAPQPVGCCRRHAHRRIPLLIKLEQFGHKFLAHFHSHPRKGSDANSSLGTDERFQQRLESAGHVA